MTLIWILIGAVLFVLGAIVSYFSGIRSLQASRRLADFRVRQKYLARARWSLAGGLFSVVVATALVFANRPAAPRQAVPSAQPTVASQTARPAPSAVVQASSTAKPAQPTPTSFVITPSPANTATLAATTTPFMPMAVQAMVQGSMTPVFPIQIGKLRFSTDINGLQLIAPGNTFHNPIKQVYAVFNYQPLATKIQWSALWYHNGGLKYIDTLSWRNSPAGIGLTSWSQDQTTWQPGNYEVQIFVGTGWKASASFTLQGDPPTITPTPTLTSTPLPATATPSQTATAAPSRTPVPAPSQAASAVPTRTPTPEPSKTATTQPSRTPVIGSPQALSTVAPATRTPAVLSTATRTATSTFTATLRPSMTASPVPTRTPTKAATQTASLTPTKSATPTPVPPTSTPSRTATPVPVTVKMFFTNTQHVDQRVPPFNDMVSRQIPASANPIAATLDEYFKGPNAQEQTRGLVGTWSGFVGYRRVEFANGILSVYLTGNCRPSGTGYSIVQPLTQTLKQFPGVAYVKVYDEYGHTRDPFGNADSGPVCLDIIFSPTPTASNTPTLTPVPSATPLPSATPSRTPLPTATASSTATSTPVPSRTPTRTPLPTATASRTPTSTPVPTRTPTNTPRPTATTVPSRTPSRTPLPTATASRTPTSTPVPTRTPTNTPRPTATPVPSNTPSRTPLPTATASRTPTSTRVPTLAPTNTPRPTATLLPSRTPSRTPLATATASRTATSTPLPTLAPTNTPRPTATASRTPLPAATRTAIPTRTQAPTATSTPAPRPTFAVAPLPTKTPLPSPTWTPTRPPIPTATQTPSRTPVPTWTSLPASTATRTLTLTPKPSATATATYTPRPSATPRPSSTATTTPYPTATRTPAPTNTVPASPTATRTPTMTPSSTPTATATMTSTATSSATPTASSTPTLTATMTFTATSSTTPTASNTPTADPRCNRAEFVGDVTISDNTVLHLSEPFTKTWRIRNSGTCTWTTGYKLTFAGGEQLGASNSEALPINVAPGQTLDISVRMVAPSSAGRYEGTWQLQSAEGKTFGFGASGKDHVWVKIRAAAPAYATSTPTPPAATATASARASASPTSTVVMTETAAPATPQVMVDFAGTACAAQWQSNTGVLSCPGKEDDPNGFVLSLSEARLEDGSTASLPTLLTFPSSSPDGYILGVYPEYPVQNGDHFQASVGCEQGATSCSVLFRLSYLDEAGAPHDLWTLGEFYDGKYFNLDLDLSGLAGHKVKLVLDIMPLGSATGDRALWVAPRIVRFPVTEATATSTPTMAPSTSTPTPGKTATAPAAATATAVSAPSPTPAAPGQPSPIQQVLDAIATFFQQLFGGK